MRFNLRYAPPAAVAGLLIVPRTAAAIQAHGAPEGIIGHQIAHWVFIFSMALLIYWLRERRLVEQAGWKYIQYAALFFSLWSLMAFAGHLLDEQLQWIRMEPVDFWRRRITVRQGPPALALLYYLLKMDHLVCVPAMIFLYLGLSRLFKTSPANTAEGPAP